MGEMDDEPATVFAEIARNPEQFAHNLARVVEEAGKAAAAFLKPREEGRIHQPTGEMATVVKTLAELCDYWVSDPERAAEAQRRLLTGYMDLWAAGMKWAMGVKPEPAAVPDPRDKRFRDPEWSNSAFFDLTKQAYLIASRWAEQLVADSEGLDPHTREKAEFYVRQIAAALSPSNFVLTNPELLRATLESKGENLARGMKMFAEDIAAGDGELRIRQSDTSRFEVGGNLAVTPGKVIAENTVCQVIQYAPATKTVLKRPLLIVPPWINKFYILDLTPEKSFIRWCVEQGHTVFVISWINPGSEAAGKSFFDYMKEGVLETVDLVEKVTGEHEINAIGYCVGGTLLAATLAYMAAKKDERIASATLFATQVDFTRAGDLKIFIDEEQIEAIETRMAEAGYLEGKTMATVFNMLRPNDLIWPYVVSNYFLGKEPAPFDLLYWNADATRMPAANHSFYLRNCYLDNKLARGGMEVGGVRLDLKKVAIPIYNLATREDHIAPPDSVLLGSKLFGGPMTFVLSGSGHIAGVVNPPDKNKYQYWTGGPARAKTLAAWLAGARETPGSWWPHWQKWILKQDKHMVPARRIGGGKVRPIEDAPGSYVKVKS